MKKILAFIKRETVLMVSLVLAGLSMFLVHPDRKYISYIDWHSITLLFCLMAVMAGFKETGLFRTIGNALLAHVHTTRQLFLVLVLITFVPFAIIVLSMSEKEHLIIPVVVMQTIAANLGSMLMPMGNPQNLYLYAKSGMSLGTFVEIMLPYTIASLLGILISMFFIKQHAIVIDRNDNAVKLPKKQIILYSIAFLLCLLNVAKLLDIRILFVIILVLFLLVSRKTLLHVDYALLGTFIGFFVFIGNMERVPAFQSFLESIITGRETYIAIGASQIISNVPTALLLSGFTTNYKALIIGTNLGGLGTLIASMASLISYKQIAREYPGKKGKYFLWFTVVNVVFLAGLMGMYSLTS